MVALLLDMSGDSDNDGTLDGVGGVAKQIGSAALSTG